MGTIRVEVVSVTRAGSLISWLRPYRLVMSHNKQELESAIEAMLQFISPIK